MTKSTCKNCGAFISDQTGKRYCYRAKCQIAKPKPKQAKPERWNVKFYNDGRRPYPEWRVKRDDLTEAEKRSTGRSGSVCFHCKFLRVCQHNVKESARLHKVIPTKCEF